MCFSLLLKYKSLSSVEGHVPAVQTVPCCGLPWGLVWCVHLSGVCGFVQTLKLLAVGGKDSLELHLHMSPVPCFQVAIANLWVIALQMRAGRNSVAKVTFQILFFGGQVSSNREPEICVHSSLHVNRGCAQKRMDLSVSCWTVRNVGCALSRAPVLLPHRKQNPATLNDQHVLMLESRADTC